MGVILEEASGTERRSHRCHLAADAERHSGGRGPLRPLSVMDRCHSRYGEILTPRVRRGRPWVFLTNPQHVKRAISLEVAMRGVFGDVEGERPARLRVRLVELTNWVTHARQDRRTNLGLS